MNNDIPEFLISNCDMSTISPSVTNKSIYNSHMYDYTHNDISKFDQINKVTVVKSTYYEYNWSCYQYIYILPQCHEDATY
jgi:hypothetical protein